MRTTDFVMFRLNKTPKMTLRARKGAPPCTAEHLAFCAVIFRFHLKYFCYCICAFIFWFATTQVPHFYNRNQQQILNFNVPRKHSFNISHNHAKSHIFVKTENLQYDATWDPEKKESASHQSWIVATRWDSDPARSAPVLKPAVNRQPSSGRKDS